MKLKLLMVIMVAVSFTQTLTNAAPLTEDRVRLLVQESSTAIEGRLDALQQKQLDLYKQDFDQRAKQVEDKIDFLNWVATLFAILLPVGISGTVIACIVWAKNYTRKRIEQETEFAIFKLDPRRWPIHIPANNFDVEKKQLEGLKYRNLIPYHGLNVNNKKGITIFPVTSTEDIDQLMVFMEEEAVDPLKCCFVIYYYTPKEKLELQRLEPYNNYVISNMPGTLSSQIFAASRNINNE